MTTYKTQEKAGHNEKMYFLLSVFLTDNHYSEKLSPAWAALIGNRPVSVKKRRHSWKKLKKNMQI